VVGVEVGEEDAVHRERVEIRAEHAAHRPRAEIEDEQLTAALDRDATLPSLQAGHDCSRTHHRDVHICLPPVGSIAASQLVSTLAPFDRQLLSLLPLGTYRRALRDGFLGEALLCAVERRTARSLLTSPLQGGVLTG
jgi:hypothetical protein